MADANPCATPYPAIAAACAPGLLPAADLQRLAQTLGLPFVGEVEPSSYRSHEILLYQSRDGLVLQQTGRGAPGPVISDFLNGKAAFRRRHGGGRGQLIAKAVGIGKRKTPLNVVDATAGLGQDAFVLATLGANVQLIERSPLVSALLADGLARLSEVSELRHLSQRMQLLEVDAQHWLTAQAGPAADVIHLDPMFPHRAKTARVKKEMSVFQKLVGDDRDSGELLATALSKARFRVAVKRPRKAPGLAGPQPDLVIEGKSTRYDVYTLAAIREP